MPGLNVWFTGPLTRKPGQPPQYTPLGMTDYLNHKIEIRSGVLAEQCSALLKTFFKIQTKRQKIELPQSSFETFFLKIAYFLIAKRSVDGLHSTTQFFRAF